MDWLAIPLFNLLDEHRDRFSPNSRILRPGSLEFSVKELSEALEAVKFSS